MNKEPVDESLMEEILKRYTKKEFNPFQFVYKMKLLMKNDKAITYALNRLLTLSHHSPNPWAYCVSILKVENGNFNEHEFQQLQKQYKKNVRDVTPLSELLKLSR